MSIPLVQNNEKDSINTSIIAIKRNIERINMLLGLSNSEEIDTSEFVKKSDIVDEVTVGNMHSVSSNAVAKALSYSTEEVFTGKYWIDGKKIYSKTFNDITLANSAVLIENVSFIVNQYGMLTYSSTLQFPIPKDAGTVGNCTIRRNPTTNQAYVDTSYANYKATITVEYTKTTD